MRFNKDVVVPRVEHRGLLGDFKDQDLVLFIDLKQKKVYSIDDHSMVFIGKAVKRVMAGREFGTADPIEWLPPTTEVLIIILEIMTLAKWFWIQIASLFDKKAANTVKAYRIVKKEAPGLL